jgi:hypothetical protein
MGRPPPNTAHSKPSRQSPFSRQGDLGGNADGAQGLALLVLAGAGVVVPFIFIDVALAGGAGVAGVFIADRAGAALRGATAAGALAAATVAVFLLAALEARGAVQAVLALGGGEGAHAEQLGDAGVLGTKIADHVGAGTPAGVVTVLAGAAFPGFGGIAAGQLHLGAFKGLGAVVIGDAALLGKGVA